LNPVATVPWKVLVNAAATNKSPLGERRGVGAGFPLSCCDQDILCATVIIAAA